MSTRKTQIGDHLTEATNESLIFLTRAFRGAVRLDDGDNKRLLAAATSTVSAWSRYEATQSAREQTRFAMAGVLARESGKTVGELMQVTMPQHSVARQLGAGSDEG